MINVSDVMEYLFCPRFIYYMYCLDIPQHEEKRYKVLKGRKLHQTRKNNNKSYIRKKIDCVKKDVEVYLSSKKYHIKGIVDEVLFLRDGTAAPLDYKFAEYREKVFRTHRYQSVLYGLMVADNYNIKVKKGFICYTRSNNRVKEIKFREKDFIVAIKLIEDVVEIIQKGVYPEGSKYKIRCIDCTYRNICL